MEEKQEEQRLRVLEIIAEYTDIPIEDIEDDVELKDGLGLDSLDIIELVIDFEKEFSCNIPDDDYAYVKTVRDFIKVVLNVI
jgi:acyl carrier protein